MVITSLDTLIDPLDSSLENVNNAMDQVGAKLPMVTRGILGVGIVIFLVYLAFLLVLWKQTF